MVSVKKHKRYRGRRGEKSRIRFRLTGFIVTGCGARKRLEQAPADGNTRAALAGWLALARARAHRTDRDRKSVVWEHNKRLECWIVRWL